MDHQRFDALTRQLGRTTSRRGVLTAIVALAATRLAAPWRAAAQPAVDCNAEPWLCDDVLIVCPGTRNCDSSLTLCCEWFGEECFDLQNDVEHCGACDAASCDGTCSGGRCACTSGREYCPSTGCVDVMSDAQNCGRCGNPCPGTSATCIAGQCCPDGYAVCWDRCANLRADPANCGACGRACAFDQPCVDGACVRSEQPQGACNAQSVRLWINAFVPGSIAGMTHPRQMNGPISVYLPMPGQIVGVDGEHPRCTDRQLCLRTDRRPDPRADQDWPAFFSHDPAAPSLAHAEIEIDLQTLQPGWQPPAAYGELVQIVDADDLGVAAIEGCKHPVEGDEFWFGELEPIDGGVRIPVAATWRGLEESSAPAGACPLDSLVVSPLGTMLGNVELRVLPEGLVQIAIPQMDLARFPAFEIYAALDDGHVGRVWASAEPPIPLAQVNTASGMTIDNATVNLPCGCGACRAEQACDTDGLCTPLDAYYVLTSASQFDIDHPHVMRESGGLVTDIDAEGWVTLELNGNETLYEGRSGATRTPAVGFLAKPGDNLRVHIEGWGQGYQAGPLFLHRVSAPFGLYDAPQVLEGGRFPLPYDRQHRIMTTGPSRPGGMCNVSSAGNVQYCVDVLSDPEQCGGLDDRGNDTCGKTEVCLNGACECPTHMTRIGPNRCADLLVDNANCGQADMVCEADSFCVEGGCVFP